MPRTETLPSAAATATILGLVTIGNGASGSSVPALDATTAGLVLQPKAGQTAGIPLIARGLASQSGVLQAWQDSTTASLASIAATGLLTLAPAVGAGALSAAQAGTMVGINSSPVVSIARTLANGGNNISTAASMLFINDNSTGTGLNQSDLLRIQAAGVDKFRLNGLGVNSVAYTSSNALNLIANPPPPVNNAQSATSGVLTNGATYVYAITMINAQGTESTIGTTLAMTMLGGGTGTSAQQTVSWSSQQGAVSYNIYRSDPNGTTLTTLAGNSIVSPFVDSLAGSVKTPPVATTLFPALRFQSIASGSGSFLTYASAYNASANYGVLAIVSAPIDGASTNKFAGNSQGTLLAMNTATANSPDFERFQVNGIDRWRLQQSGILTQSYSDAATNTAVASLLLQHRTSGTPAANFGYTQKVQLDSSNNTARDASALVTTWTTATDASQASQMALQLVTAGGALTTAATLIPGGWSAPTALVSDAATNTVPTTLTVYHKTSGTAAASLGTTSLWAADSDTTASRTQMSIVNSWVVATDASRTARATFNVFDTASREGFRMEASGAAIKTSVNGVAAVVRPASSATATDLASVITLANNLKTILTNFGICT